MIRNLIKFVRELGTKVLKSIAFYPVLLAISFFIIALLILKIENSEFIATIKQELPFLFISDFETARTILTTFIGGIISLTVFSFSMVMVVLNQASSNFSPRLLPNLVSNKKHQIILGVYIGTLLYFIFILIALGAEGVESNSIGLSTMLAAIFGVVCVGLFVYFIHNISTAIQINNIIDRIYRSSSKSLEKAYKNQQNKIALRHSESAGFRSILSDKTGYFSGFYVSLMAENLKSNGYQFNITPYLNQHIYKGDVIAEVSENLSDEEEKALLFCFTISTNRHDGDEGISGLIKLSEIAVKAMSPGINDPGTAIEAIVKIGKLLYTTVAFANATSQKLEQKNLIIVTHNISVDELLRIIIQPIRFYAKEDCMVLFQLIKTLQYVLRNPKISIDNKHSLETELTNLKIDIQENIKNKADQKKLLEAF
ncbi:DUF2254 domain-containing protein [Cellulophaga sp. Hel_I_12]|uniref:DUF2254 domain-containing protein n=1 Tax=Cellulophaga sp. Hel_I_12 TaxID=1249972 RepID=UPI000646986B|nr:DUF2254 domain-containing protein [Cellulophaga sp. Hel_I_12]